MTGEFCTRGNVDCHIVAETFRYCGKEFKRKLEQGPVDHDIDVKIKLYENGRVAADPEMLRRLADLSEREIADGAGVHRSRIRLLRRALTQFTEHYHAERNHQGKGNLLLFPSHDAGRVRCDRTVACRECLGGLLKYYSRTA